MTVIDKTDPSQTASLAFEVALRHRPSKVWRALTDPVLLAEWLLPAVGFKLDVGAAFLFQTEPMPGWDGKVACQLVVAEPERQLSYTWRVGDMDTVVTFTLTPTDEGTLLSLVQSGFTPAQKQNFGGARYGWRMMGTKLTDVLDGLA